MTVSTTVGELLDKKGRRVVTIDADATTVRCASAMIEQQVGSLMVLVQGRLEGILTWHDLLRLLALGGDDLRRARAGDLMARDVLTTTEDALLADVERTMVDRHIRHLPVIGDGGALVGVVTRVDVLARHLDHTAAWSADLHNYVTGKYPG